MPDEEDEKDIYSEKGREDLVESGEISAAEEGFMEGAHDGGQGGKCRNCGKPIGDDFIETEIEGEYYRFCCDECLEKFKKKE